jgi:hypothetical protein
MIKKVTLTIAWTTPNILGGSIVGKGLIILCFTVMAPFMVLTYLGFSKGSISNLLVLKPNRSFGVEWYNLLNALYFNYSGFDCTSTGENSKKTV